MAYKIPSMKEIEQIPYNGYNVISTFSGMGGMSLGYHMDGYKIGSALEFIPEAAKTYRANFRDTAVVEADIRDVTGKDLINKANFQNTEVHVLEGSPPCLIPGQLIITDKGYKKIEEINTNDDVYTHKGRFRKVLKTMSRNYLGNIRSIQVNGFCIPIGVTDEHPLFVYRGKSDNRDYNNAKWIPASDVREGDFIVYHLGENQQDYCDISKAEFLGYYMMCGVLDKRGRISFNTNNNPKLGNSIKDAYYKAFEGDCSEYSFAGGDYLAFDNEEAVNFCKVIGNKSDKIIPEAVIYSSLDFLKEFVRAIINTDKGKTGVFFRAGKNLKMFLALQRIFMRVGTFPNLYINDSRNKVNEFEYCAFTINSTEMSRCCYPKDCWFRKGDYAYIKVEKIIDIAYEGLVYNLEVEEDNSYCCHYITTHNCSDFSSQHFSSSGKDKGKLKTYSDTKQKVDDLFFEYARILGDINPWVFTAENVESIMDEDKRVYLNEFLSAFKQKGYVVAVRKMDFSDYGVPQARKRAIFIGVRKDLVDKYTISPFDGYPEPVGYVVTTGEAIGDLVDMLPDMEMTDLEKKYAKLIPTGSGTDYIKMLRDKYFIKIMMFNHRRDTWDIPHPTIVQNTRHIHPLKNRWLTVAEAKRIASIPDDFILTGSTTDQWERIGRCVCPLFGYHLSKSIRINILDKIK